MRINPINNNNTFSNRTFKSSAREYMDYSLKFAIETGGLISTYTSLFREDMNWAIFSKIINENFRETEKVNIYSLACSDGSEAYTTAISILENCENPQKFFPISAIDKDKIILKHAQNYRINLFDEDLAKLRKITQKKYFIDKSNCTKVEGESVHSQKMHSYSPINQLKDNIHFELGDIKKVLENINDNGNSVILCRNVFPYLSNYDHAYILNQLKKNLKKGSIFVIGQYDSHTLIDRKLLDFGFKEIRTFIFKKL